MSLRIFRSTRYELLRTSIEESVKCLTKRDSILCDHFKKLVIFTDNVNIPLKVN